MIQRRNVQFCTTVYLETSGLTRPGFSRDHDQFDFSGYNTATVLKSWVSKGAHREKLVVGVPFYGRSFTLTSINQNKPGAASVGPGAPGEYTNEEGFLSYYEICSKIRSEQGWTTKRDSDGNVYAVRGDQWVGFDTDNAVKRKVLEAQITSVFKYLLRARYFFISDATCKTGGVWRWNDLGR